MRFAIYSRKSKFTGKGESIGNQIEMCTEYINMHFNKDEIDEIAIFEDEGFSGKNLNRPQFQNMMKQNEQKKFDFIVVYRLDRISRNVGDFSSLIERLNDKGVSFICIKEQFDTSTPMGRAMMNIAAVFAQLERETIAERVRDNMHMLARTGRWLGGMTPTGYKSVKNDEVDLGDGKKRSSYSLEIDEDEIDIVKIIYDKFIETESLHKLETFCLTNGIKSKKENNFSVSTIRQILCNPVYCMADETSCEYFKNNNADICFTDDEIDGESGYTTYNRTQGNQQRNKNDIEKWIVSIGKHQGIINGETWVKVQELLAINAHKMFRKVHNSDALLSGIIKCSCGSYMRPKYHHPNNTGTRTFSYMCELKERSKKCLCDNTNVSGRAIDEAVITILLDFETEGAVINEKLKKLKSMVNNTKTDIDQKKSEFQKLINEKQNAIQGLVLALAKGVTDTTHNIINAEIENLSKQTVELTHEIEQFKTEDEQKNLLEQQIFEIDKCLRYLKDNYDVMSVVDKRDIIRSTVSKIIWDGKQIHIFILGVQ